MSAAILAATPARPLMSPPGFLASLFRAEPTMAGMGLAMIALMPPTLLAMTVDERTVLGINVWDKPFKFEVALAVYALTLAFFARYMPEGVTERRWYRAYIAVVAFCITIEMLWIGGAAALGTASHFNVTSPVWSALYSLMGVAAVTLTSATAVQGVQIWRNARSRLSPAMRLAIVSSLLLTFVLTVLTAGTLASMGSHFIGGTASDAVGSVFFGWSRDGGDLRVSHFLATHAMHAIPLAALASTAAFGALRRAPVILIAAGFAALTLFTYIQALSGKPFLPGIL